MRLLVQLRLVHSAAAGPLMSLGRISPRYTQGMGPLPCEKPSTNPITASSEIIPSTFTDTAEHHNTMAVRQAAQSQELLTDFQASFRPYARVTPQGSSLMRKVMTLTMTPPFKIQQT